ncbi:2,3-diaminopropionate biosynthesis protein SbnA [Sorangium sp. So ce204]|uniref:2,3-diaminopropionate biosynthesis protein SbnA n=1 Tax=Sorangium sp. So ce204 TaxID=3133288 RepID=UPI003F602C8F
MAEKLLTKVTSLLGTLRETTVLPLECDGVKLFAKIEGHNPVGSLKDRPALWILHQAIKRGEIHDKTVLIESSSGNFAVALAFYARQLGLEFIPVIDPNTTEAYESLLRRLCPSVVKVTEPDDMGGYLKARLQKLRELRESIHDSYWTNQYGNMDAVGAHYRFTGEEICSAFSELHYVFVGVSTGATIAGISRRVKEAFPNARIIAVDAQGSVIFGGAPGPRHIAGIGASVRSKLVDEAKIDDVVLVSEVETVRACRELLTRHGLLVGGSSGSCYAAVKKLLPRMRSTSRPSVLFVCADRGISYADTIFNDAWTSRLGA